MRISKKKTIIALAVLVIVQLAAPFPDVVHEIIGYALGIFFLLILVREIIALIDKYRPDDLL